MSRVFVFIVFLVFPVFPATLPGITQTTSTERIIKWYRTELPAIPENNRSEPQTRIKYLRLPGNHDRNTHFDLPIYNELIIAPGYYPESSIEIADMRFEELDNIDYVFINRIKNIDNSIGVEQKWVITRGEPALQLSFLPLRVNPSTGRAEKLTSFSFRFKESEVITRPSGTGTKQSYTSNSLLNSGQWVKIRTTKDGIYRLTYSDLEQMGFASPSNIRIFGNTNRMLPKMAGEPRPVDLNEISIFISSGEGGAFSRGDYILFYGQGPESWEYNELSGMFEYERHLYSAGNYYFITSSGSAGETVRQKETPVSVPNRQTEEFDDYDFHEEEIVNLLKSGRQWFGEHFRVRTSYDFSFSFPNAVSNSEAKLKWQVASRSPVATSFSLVHNSTAVDQLILPSVNPGSEISDYAAVRKGWTSFNITGDNTVLTVNYAQNTASAEGWLDYLLLNVRRSLIMTGNQMHFRDTRSVGEGAVTQFRLSGAGGDIRIWDVTDPLNAASLATEFSDGSAYIIDETSGLNQYIAFYGDNYLEPEIIGPVPNQNLHGTGRTDMVIVTHPDFISQAAQLATHRQKNDGLEVLVATPEQIYNEFSSGKPDITAIRDFMKMLYDRAESEPEMPRYLLLFGKGSYDNRPGNPSAMNFIPTYQSPNSIRPTQSFVSDDFYGLLDDGEGEFEGLVDIGTGRLPVSSPEQAQAVVNKIINYNTAGKKGDWQNILSFIGDDGDNNIHMRDADILAEGVKSNYPVYNIEKIYLDAWPKIGTSLGQRYPGVNQAISERIRKGSLIINYTGHGNELRLADENIIDINDVLSWNNRDRQPVFMTATCEFSRFDNPERVSAGEMLLLNPDGGGIALFSTTRLVYATPNFFLNQNFYRFILERYYSGREMRLGDVMRLTKINSGSGINKRNFTLLGDPSMKLAIPDYRIEVTSINESPVSETPDTLRALGKVTVSGRIVTSGGVPADDFNGVVYHTVYDKKLASTTLGNDGSTPFSYSSRSNVIYKGKASVTSGIYSFSFIVPKDIAYHFGNGKISSFAADGLSDAAGYYKNVIIGGSDPDAQVDSRGPEIELYMNDQNFVSGGMTDQNPRLIAYLTDSSGINTVGSGIGHDITLLINNDPSTLLVLNDYYVADADSYQSGKIEYQFSDLEPGNYNLKLKAWDVFNNSSETGIEFQVAESARLTLRNVFNYPNPFTQNTTFHFEHNRPDNPMDLLIQIFTVAGRLVKTIDASVHTPGFKPEPVPWDGKDDYGDRIGRGVYIYRLRLRSADGETAEKYEKLVILK